MRFSKYDKLNMINILKMRKYDKMQYDKDLVEVYHIAVSKYE